MQQAWLKQRLDTFLPPLMRKHGIDLWVVPMREYNEDPVFTVHRRARNVRGAAAHDLRVLRQVRGRGHGRDARRASNDIALGGIVAGRRVRSAHIDSAPSTGGGAVRGRQAELWGDEQWQLLKTVIEERKPRVIGINRSTVFAFTDGLSSGELEGMSRALGPGVDVEVQGRRTAAARSHRVAAARRGSVLPEDDRARLADDADDVLRKVIVPGKTRTSDLVWWWRQRVNDQGLGTWFQPSVDVQRQGSAPLGADPIIQPGDVLHCDVGITVARLNTDTQHLAYVLKPGETDAPAGLKHALANANAMQDMTMEEIRPGRTGNEILQAVLARMKAKGIDGTLYSHPIGLHGHGAGPLIGLWDRQEGVPGRGDAKVIPSMWFSIELQATTPVPEWGGQPVRMAQEEDMIVGADGKVRWALKRQDKLFLIKTDR